MLLFTVLWHMSFLKLIPTWSDACERQGELAYEVVPGCFVVVLHHKPNQGQARVVDDEVQSLVPNRVKTCRKTRGVMEVLYISGEHCAPAYHYDCLMWSYRYLEATSS